VATDRIILDSGALSALAHEEEGIRVALRLATAAGAEIVVPTPVVTESTTGNSRHDANVNRALKATTIAPLDEQTARAAGALRYQQRRRHAGAIDAMVVACADQQAGSTIYTADPDDLIALADERQRTRVLTI
jgi:predicted nucleic acid-binding protein